MEKAVGVGVYEKPRVSRGGVKLHIIQLGGMGKCISSPSSVWNEIKMTKNCRVTEQLLLCGALQARGPGQWPLSPLPKAGSAMWTVSIKDTQTTSLTREAWKTGKLTKTGMGTSTGGAKKDQAPFFRSQVMDENRPHVSISTQELPAMFWHCWSWLPTGRASSSLKNLPLSQKVLFQNKWRKKTKANPSSPGKLPLKGREAGHNNNDSYSSNREACWWVTCPCMFMMTTVLERLQTTNCSTLRGSGWMLWTVMSVPARPPRDLNVFRHSVLFMFHTFIVPSELALECHSYMLQLSTDWLTEFYPTQNRSFRRRSSQPISWLSTEKTKENMHPSVTKYTTTQNEH